jgi:hypothetical protein
MVVVALVIGRSGSRLSNTITSAPSNQPIFVPADQGQIRAIRVTCGKVDCRNICQLPHRYEKIQSFHNHEKDGPY